MVILILIQLVGKTHKDLQQSTLTHNDPQRATTIQKRSTGIHRNPQQYSTIQWPQQPKIPKTIQNNPQWLKIIIIIIIIISLFHFG